jgi:hypothetical protein
VPLDDEGTLLERVRRWEWATGKSNFPSLLGVPDAVGYGPAESADKWRVFRAVGAADEGRMLRLLGVSRRILCTATGVRVEPMPRPLPRASMVAGKRAADPVQELTSGDPAATSVVTEPALEVAAAPDARAELIEDRPELQRIRVTGGGGLLRVLDSYARGWSAEIDGAPAVLGKADVLWRGVPVPPGDHEVRLRFRTPGLVAGAWMSGVTLLALIAIALRSRR